jgi:two-component system, OmpR family, KDP operon response regulator KdpE
VLYKTTQQETLQNTYQTHILVIDDDKAVKRFLHTVLNAYGYSVHEAATGQEGILHMVTLEPDIILLDIDLPDMTGIEVLKAVREWSKTPILILSVHNRDTEIVEALDAGADDYIAKPFSMSELMARIRLALRHVQPTNSDSIFVSDDLKVNLAARTVEIRGQHISLTPTEYDLLRVLVNHAGKVVTHHQLWQKVRSDVADVDSHLIRVHMSNLRRKLELEQTEPQYILTVPGVGYRLHVAE